MHRLLFIILGLIVISSFSSGRKRKENVLQVRIDSQQANKEIVLFANGIKGLFGFANSRIYRVPLSKKNYFSVIDAITLEENLETMQYLSYDYILSSEDYSRLYTLCKSDLEVLIHGGSVEISKVEIVYTKGVNLVIDRLRTELKTESDELFTNLGVNKYPYHIEVLIYLEDGVNRVSFSFLLVDKDILKLEEEHLKTLYSRFQMDSLKNILKGDTLGNVSNGITK